MRNVRGIPQEAEQAVESISEVIGPWSTRNWENIDKNNVYITQVITKGDPWANSYKMLQDKKGEIQRLLRRGRFKVVLQEKVPHDANILGGRFFLAIKNTDTQEQRYKARFIIQGNLDKEKKDDGTWFTKFSSRLSSTFVCPCLDYGIQRLVKRHLSSLIAGQKFISTQRRNFNSVQTRSWRLWNHFTAWQIPAIGGIASWNLISSTSWICCQPKVTLACTTSMLLVN